MKSHSINPELIGLNHFAVIIDHNAAPPPQPGNIKRLQNFTNSP